MQFYRLMRALVVATSVGLLLAACSAPDDLRVGAQTANLDGITGATADGQPGVDYSTSIIAVVYRLGAIPLGILSLSSPAPGKRAADQPNAILRENKEYEPLTDAIAARCGLLIRSQVYIGGCNTAAFNVPPGVDPALALARVRSAFAGSLISAGFAGLAYGGMTPNDPDFAGSNPLGNSAQWGQKLIGCEAAWEISTGDSGFMVAVVDTGVYYDHEELTGQVLVPEVAFPGEMLDIANGDNIVEDDDGHGTALSGLIAAKTNDNRTLASIAFNCKILPVKIGNDIEIGAPWSDIAAGVMLAATLGARVINLSWFGARSPDMENAVDELVSQGKLLVVCAGNNSSASSSYPAGYPGCMSVGAIDPDDSRSWFSNRGPDVDIAAPGGGNNAETYLKYCGTGLPDFYVTGWGTSFSAPMVAAGAALLWTYNPSMTLDEVRYCLEQTGPVATDFDSAGHPVRRLDLAAALQEALPGAAVEGTVVDNTGAPLSGVTLTLGSQGSAQSDSTGVFRFPNVLAGNFMLAPASSGYFFQPNSIDVTVGSTNVTDLAFVGWPDTYPLLGSLSVQDGEVFGAVVGSNVLSVTATSLLHTTSVRYTLDLAPIGHVDPNDLNATSTDEAGGFPAAFGVAMPLLRNQKARLTAVPINASAQEGPALSANVTVFNLLGDANADGLVDHLDLEAYPAKAGLTQADPGYSIFFDSDRDGVITEADAAAVGYFFGSASM